MTKLNRREFSKSTLTVPLLALPNFNNYIKLDDGMLNYFSDVYQNILKDDIFDIFTHTEIDGKENIITGKVVDGPYSTVCWNDTSSSDSKSKIIPSYPIGSSIDCKNNDYPSLKDKMKIAFEASFIKRIRDDAWKTILSAATNNKPKLWDRNYNDVFCGENGFSTLIPNEKLNIKLHLLEELDEEYKDYFLQCIKWDEQQIDLLKTKRIAIALDLSNKKEDFIIQTSKLQMFDDPTLSLNRRKGIYGYMNIGIGLNMSCVHFLDY